MVAVNLGDDNHRRAHSIPVHYRTFTTTKMVSMYAPLFKYDESTMYRVPWNNSWE